MITRKLPVKLTNEEVRLRGKRLAALQAEIASLETKKKAAADDFKSQIGERETEMSRLTREINEERELRDVQVTEEKNWELGEVHLIRLDTGEVVEIRPMTPQELKRPSLFPARGERAETAASE